MAAVLQSRQVKNNNAPLTADGAEPVILTGTLTLTAALVVNDLLEMVILPAGYVPVDVTVVPLTPLLVADPAALEVGVAQALVEGERPALKESVAQRRSAGGFRQGEQILALEAHAAAGRFEQAQHQLLTGGRRHGRHAQVYQILQFLTPRLLLLLPVIATLL